MLLAFPVHACASLLLRKGFFNASVVEGSQMPVLTCSSLTTSLSDPRRSWVSQTWAGWLSVLWSPVVRYLSFAFGHDRARGQQPCLQHHGRLLDNRRNSDGPRFYMANNGIGGFLFLTLGRHSNNPTCLSSGPS